MDVQSLLFDSGLLLIPGICSNQPETLSAEHLNDLELTASGNWHKRFGCLFYNRLLKRCRCSTILVLTQNQHISGGC
jgi:hypothetical protein